MDESEVAELAFLWDGSAPEWCLQVFDRRERRITIVFGEAGATSREVLGMREVFDELHERPVHEVWAEVAGKARFSIREVYSPTKATAVADEARRRGLRVEVQASDSVGHMPINKRTGHLLQIDDDELAACVVERMLAAGVRCERTN